MGTIGAYTGAGGAAGDALRDAVHRWLDQLPQGFPEQTPPQQAPPDQPSPHPRIDQAALLNAIALLAPRSSSGGSDGPGGGGGGGGGAAGGAQGGGGGGAMRTAAGSAGSAGRAAAGAFAYRTGDVDTLARLGLDYVELRALDDRTEVVRQIVEAAFASQPDSSIPDHEQRLVAADIADWVIGDDDGGAAPNAEEIVRHTIAVIIAEAALVETGDLATRHPNGAMTHDEIREAADALASQATLSPQGVTEQELSDAIEGGIETLRQIQGGPQ